MYSPSSAYYWSKIQQGSKRTEAKCKATANTICTFVIALRAAKIRHQFILLHLTVAEAEIRQLLTICKPPRYIDFRSNETVTETSYTNPEMGSWKHVRFMCHTPPWPSWPRPRCTSPLPLLATGAWPALCRKKSRLPMSICLRPRPLKKGRTALTYWTCRKRQFRLQLLVHVPLFKMELWWVKFFSEHAVFISATHSTSKTEEQTFKAKNASTFYMVGSNKALIPYNMHTWNMILQKCCSRCITHLPHNAVVGEEWDAFVCVLLVLCIISSFLWISPTTTT